MDEKRRLSDDPPVLNRVEARQGERQFGFRVLAVSIALAVVGFAAVYFVIEMTDDTPRPARVEQTSPDESSPDGVRDVTPPPDSPPAD